MQPYLDLFLIVVVLLTATSDGEAAGGRRSVVGGIEVRCPEGKLHEGVGCLVGGIEIEQIGGQAAARVSGFEQFCLSRDSGKKIALIPGSRDFLGNFIFLIKPPEFNI